MKLLALATLGYITIGGLVFFAQSLAPVVGEIGPLAQLGAVGVMAWLTKALLGELRDARQDSAAQRKEHQEAFQVADDRRHKDIEAMQATMIEMVRTCSAARRGDADRDLHEPQRNPRPAKSGGT